jgi:hypothetical protein
LKVAKRKHGDTSTDVPDTSNTDSTPRVAEKTQGETLHTSKKARKSKGQTPKDSDKENDKDALLLIRRK